MSDFVPIAEIVKAVGLRGEIKLYHLIDFHGPLLDTDFLVWEDGEPLRVTGWRSVKGATVISVDSIADRNAAEAAVGRLLGFRRESYRDEAFPRPGGGLAFRLVGREVRLGDGSLIGRVDEVRRYGAQLTLVILRDGREVLIPAVAPILRQDDALEGPLTIDPPEGLLDGA